MPLDAMREETKSVKTPDALSEEMEVGCSPRMPANGIQNALLLCPSKEGGEDVQFFEGRSKGQVENSG